MLKTVIKIDSEADFFYGELGNEKKLYAEHFVVFGGIFILFYL